MCQHPLCYEALISPRVRRRDRVEKEILRLIYTDRWRQGKLDRGSEGNMILYRNRLRRGERDTDRKRVRDRERNPFNSIQLLSDNVLLN